ncbi:hypothetical protein BDV93DRAFT_553107 [Ceratobasidium sp. AG-I]|nr:hypothetical protein BDV93DRAFT_553107 [Ceratobasidium sp. AG-I]
MSPSPLSNTQSIELLSLRSINVHTGSSILAWLFSTLILGDHDVSLCIHVTGYFGDSGLAMLNDSMVSFFQRTLIKSLFMGGNWPVFPPLFTCLPHLQHLGLDLSTALTGEFDDQYYPANDEMDTGLCFLLSLPSVRQIMYRPNVHYAEPDTQERVLRLLSKGGITALVIITNESKIPAVSQLSPFVA